MLLIFQRGSDKRYFLPFKNRKIIAYTNGIGV